MKLSDEQRAALAAAATDAGLAPDEVIAAAEAEANAPDAGPPTPATAPEKPPLFQYHLPFLRVRELRAVWLGLDERIDGDELTTGAWLAKYGGGTGGGTPA